MEKVILSVVVTLVLAHVYHQLIYQYVVVSLKAFGQFLQVDIAVPFAEVTEVEKTILSTTELLGLAPVSHQAQYQYVDQSESEHNPNLAVDMLLAVFAALAEVEKVILSVVATLAFVLPHQLYQYVEASLNQETQYLLDDKLLAVFAAQAQVENVILSTVAYNVQDQLVHQIAVYQYVVVSLTAHHSHNLAVVIFQVVNAAVIEVAKVILSVVTTGAQVPPQEKYQYVGVGALLGISIQSILEILAFAIQSKLDTLVIDIQLIELIVAIKLQR